MAPKKGVKRFRSDDSIVNSQNTILLKKYVSSVKEQLERERLSTSLCCAPQSSLSLWDCVVLDALQRHEDVLRRVKRHSAWQRRVKKDLLRYQAAISRYETQERAKMEQECTKLAAASGKAVERRWRRLGGFYYKQQKVPYDLIKQKAAENKQEEMLQQTERLTMQLVESVLGKSNCTSSPVNDVNFDETKQLKLFNTEEGKRPLRHYQRVALRWLIQLYSHGLNAILADEMGLGKTVQTIALLCYFAEHQKDWGPHLIVVPTTVVLNWEMEFYRWAPGFKIIAYLGSKEKRKKLREGWSKEGSFDVCITSYNLIVNDHDVFKRKAWGFMILDEAHHIKNFASRTWQSLYELHAQYRLLLTGTPLQSSIMELWSLFHFLLPHATAFKSYEEFQSWYSNPVNDMISGNATLDEGIVRRLQALFRPFLLRRIKKDVEPQLPKKIEKVILCPFSHRQRTIYNEFMNLRDTKERIKSGGYQGIFTIILSLRKVCNHPDLFEERPVVSPFVMPHYHKITFPVPTAALLYSEINQLDRGHVGPYLLPLRMLPDNEKAYGRLSDAQCLIRFSEKRFTLPVEKAGKRGRTEQQNTQILSFLPPLKSCDVGETRERVFSKHYKDLLISLESSSGIASFPVETLRCLSVDFTQNVIQPQVDELERSTYDPCEDGYTTSLLYRHGLLLYPPERSIQKGSVREVLRSENRIKRWERREMLTPFVKSVAIRAEEVERELGLFSIYVPHAIVATPAVFSPMMSSSIMLLPYSGIKNSLHEFPCAQSEWKSSPAYRLLEVDDVRPLTTSLEHNTIQSYRASFRRWTASLALSRQSGVAATGRRVLITVIKSSHERPDPPSYTGYVVPTGVHSSASFCSFAWKGITRRFINFSDKSLLIHDSGKFQILKNLIPTLRANGHRMLIFSQFTAMIELLQKFLARMAIPSMRIDGSTKAEERQMFVERFNADERITCMVLSTRSGGIGLNLTGADTVIFYDSDWNPTVDLQAQDRVHRIGQTREVTVYRLVCENSVEEQILKKSRERKMLQNVVIRSGGFDKAAWEHHEETNEEGVSSPKTSETGQLNLKFTKKGLRSFFQVSSSSDSESSDESEADVTQAMNAAEDEADRAARTALVNELAAAGREETMIEDSDIDNEDNEAELCVAPQSIVEGVSEVEAAAINRSMNEVVRKLETPVERLLLRNYALRHPSKKKHYRDLLSEEFSSFVTDGK